MMYYGVQEVEYSVDKPLNREPPVKRLVARYLLIFSISPSMILPSPPFKSCKTC